MARAARSTEAPLIMQWEDHAMGTSGRAIHFPPESYLPSGTAPQGE